MRASDFDEKHSPDCDYWCDQYPWECNCGVIDPPKELDALREKINKFNGD